jgi:type II secretory pathway component PulF
LPRFRYQAVDDYGKRVEGTLLAVDEKALHETLAGMMLHPLSAKELAGGVEDSPAFRKKVKREELILFTFPFKTMVAAGVPLVTALGDLVEQVDNPTLKDVLQDIRRNIQAGAGLSDAFALHPSVFPELYVSILRAGETSGKLDEALEDLIKFLTRQEELVKQVKQATYYPMSVLSAVAMLIFLLFSFVFPRFLEIFKSARVELPLPTRIVIAISEFFRDRWPIMIATIGATVGGLHLYRRTEEGRLRTDGWKLKMPIVGELLRALEVSQLCHFLASLFRSGVEMTRSLTVVERLVGNRVLAKTVQQAREELLAGGSLSASLRNSGHFPTLVLRMISIGESTGTLDDMLENVSQYYEREIPRVIKKIFAILEPVVLMFLAFVVLGAALSFFLALYKMAGSMAQT